MAATKPSERSSVVSTDTPEHRPYVPDEVQMAEFTWPAVIVGSLLGIVFGASSLYLVLKVGLTVSASIPVAVMSITLFRLFSRLFGMRPTTILENNIVQTAGSAGESIAFGVGVTMPALMILGFEMDIGRVVVVAVLGGLLGILMMIPLRRAFIVKQHGKLKYPEGTACADVLIVGEQGGSSAKTVFIGFGLAFVYKFLMDGMRLWKGTVEHSLSWFKGAVPAIDVDPALLGVGYIIGTRVACVMAAGGILASFVLIPAIRLFGDPLKEVIFPATELIGRMSEEQIWHDYILYIGAGAVAAGGIISLAQAMPLIVNSIVSAAKDMRGARQGAAVAIRRTDRDMPLWLVGVGALVLVGAIWSTSFLHGVVPWIPQLEMNLVGALMIVLFGFLFVTVSSRLTGEIGSSSNPISGMTVATLLLTCVVFFLWHRAAYAEHPDLRSKDLLAAISVAAVVCISASNGGTTSQDLKTGFLIGATPVWQQWAILIGTLTSAVVIGGILILLNNAGTIYSSSPRNLPQLRQPLDVTKLPDLEKAPDDKAVYHVWHATEGNAEGARPGKYLVDDKGSIHYLVDPGINGRLDYRDDGTEAQKFKAPKARLMSLIADGILRQKLPWSLVLLGVSIAVVLELCGVPSLPFAVGVYLPLSASMPIFAGGLIRYVSEKWGRGAKEAGRGEQESDMSSGVLISTGYIAGGAIAGVLVAFLSFSQEIPKVLARWEYRTVEVPDKPTFMLQLDEVAARQLGIADDKADPSSGGGAKPEVSENRPAGDFAAPETANESDTARRKRITALRWEIITLNKDELAKHSVLKAGTILKLPNGDNFRVPRDEKLADVAQDALKDANKTHEILQQNEEIVPLPEKLPPGVRVKLPLVNWPSLVTFGALCLFLLVVGLGWLLPGGAAMKPPKRSPTNPPPPANPESGGKMPDRKAPIKQP